MPATGYPVRMADGVPVITAPAEIDITNVGELQAVLSDWRTRGHATVVVDMTGTQFCDSAGLTELVQAHRQAIAEGGGLRLIIAADQPVLRIFTLIGVDRVIPASPAWKRPWPRRLPPRPRRAARRHWPGSMAR